MQTFAHDLTPALPHFVKTSSGQRPFKTIALLACVAFAISACKTTTTHAPPPRAEDGRQQQRPAASYAHLEPEEVAQGLFNMGKNLIQQGKTQEGFTTLDELERRFGQDPRRSVRALLAQALSLKAQSAATPTESLAAQVEIGRRYGEDIDPVLRRQLVTAMFDQAATLGKEGNLSEAIPIYREIEQTYGEGAGNDKSWGVWALVYQAELQRQMRNHRAAVSAYDRLDKRYSQETDPAIRAVVADSLFKKGETLAEQGNVRAAIVVYEEIGRRYAEDRDANFRLRAMRALFAKGTLLSRQAPGAGEDPESETPIHIRPTGDTAAAVAVFDDIVQRFGRDKDPNINNFVGGTLLKKSETLRLTGNDQATIAVYDEIIGRYGNDNTQAARVLVATALFRKGLTLEKQEGATNAALNTYDEVVRRFANDTNQNVRRVVGQAVTARQRLLAKMEPMHDN